MSSWAQSLRNLEDSSGRGVWRLMQKALRQLRQRALALERILPENYGLSEGFVVVVLAPSFLFNFGGACCCSPDFCSVPVPVPVSVVVVPVSSGVGDRRFKVGRPGAPPSSPAAIAPDDVARAFDSRNSLPFTL